MSLKEKRDIRPLLVKFGAAVAVSFAAFLYSRFRNKKTNPCLPPLLPRSSDHGSEVGSKGGEAQHRNCLNASVSEEIQTQRPNINNSVPGLSPCHRHSGDRNEYLLLDSAAIPAVYSPKKDAETPKSDSRGERVDYEQEIRHLRNLVRILRERERSLEVQLLEYYGLKEQETAVMELQNRLKINHMETKLFNLKIESLQADNRRLEAQVADHAKVAAELEAARSKIKLLKKKLKSEAQQNKEHILTLQQRVTELQQLELKASAADSDAQKKLQRLEDLEVEADLLSKSNMRLQFENSELARRLESTQILANSILEDAETQGLKEESDRMRNENEDLKRKLEKLQADRCADIEELVYLRWLNACLRYELRNYLPPPGKTVARDLSKTLSPKSERKAKQLILEYAHTEGLGEKGLSMMDVDSDQWSSSQASYITDSGDLDDSSVGTSSAAGTINSYRKNIFRKFKSLVRGKDVNQHSRTSSADRSASSEDWESMGCSSSTGGDTTAELQNSRLRMPIQFNPRHSMDFQRLKRDGGEDSREVKISHRKSDVGSYGYKRPALGRQGSSDLVLENQIDPESDSSRKSELKKFAEALKKSYHRPKWHKK